MQFGSVDGFLYVARITGPTHNLLQLKISTAPPSVLHCDELHAAEGCNHGKLEQAKIQEAVRAGIAAANAACGTEFHPVHIRYVSNDTGPEDVYRLLAEVLVSRVATGELTAD